MYKYKLNVVLLNNIVKIKNLITDLNGQKFPSLILAKFEKDSFAVSAFASTSIEGNPLRLTDVKQILKQTPSHIRDTEREVLNYNKALEYLSKLKNNVVDEKFICNIQGIVTENLMDKKNIGKVRNEGVVVNDPRLRKIIYIPPDYKDVKKLIKDLSNFLEEEKNNLDPLILAGIFHKQFVIIHPFMDGNGRTTRLITKYLLARMGLDTFNLFSFENYYNQNVTKYFENVGVFGDYYDLEEKIDFTNWLIYFTDGIIDELLRVQKLLQQTINIVRQNQWEKKILNFITKNGSISEAEYSKITKRARSTRILDFKRMVEKGLIERHEQSTATYYTQKTL